MNVSYRKIMLDGVVLNPIQAGRPLQHPFPNRRQRRARDGRRMSNASTSGVIVTRIGYGTFLKYQKVVQVIPADLSTKHTTTVEGKKVTVSRKPTPQRTIVHYRPVN